MGMGMLETCWSVSKRQVIKLISCCILLVDSVDNISWYLRLTELLCSFLESAFDSLSQNNINKRTRSCVCVYLYQFGKAQDKVRAFTLPNSFGATNQPAMACGCTDILLRSAASVFRVGKHVLTLVWCCWWKWNGDYSVSEGQLEKHFLVYCKGSIFVRQTGNYLYHLL